MTQFSAQAPRPIPGANQRHGFEMRTHARYDWHLVHHEWSGIESEMYPWDPAVVRAIREEVDPDFVPLRVRTVWEAPTGEQRIYEHHALGFVTSDPHRKHQNRRVLWPSMLGSVNYGRGSRGTLVVEKILERDRTHVILPGDFAPLSWGVYHQMKAAVQINRETTPQDDARVVENQLAEKEARRQKGLAEIDYRIEHDAAHIKSQLDKLSGPEYERMDAREPERKPFVA